MDIALRAGDAESARAHRLEMRAARQEGDVGTRFREPAPEVPAYASTPDHGDAHRANAITARPGGAARAIKN
jgi:hypothetical protein